MPSPYAGARSRRSTAPTDKIPGREADQVRNNAGGVGFKMDPWTRLAQFLILGTEGGTYYVKAPKLTRDALSFVEGLIATDGPQVVATTVEISKAGRAPRNSPAIWVLAACSVLGNDETKAAANAALGEVCRIGTHLFEWAACVRELKGNLAFGAGQRRAVTRWYTGRPADALAYQVLKYQQRGGFSHRDMLRLAKPGSKTTGGKVEDPALRAVLGYATGDPLGEPMPAQIVAFQAIHGEGMTEARVVELITENRLTREMIPTEWLSKVAVWEALLQTMPVGAMVRSLGKMSSIGLLKPLSAAESLVVERLTDADRIRKARLHPATLVNALKIYAGGHGLRGSLSWSPSSTVTAALDEATDLAFGQLEPCGKRMLIAIDNSGSMTWDHTRCAGLEALRAVEGAAVMAIATARHEKRYHIIGFDGSIHQTGLNARSSYADAVKAFGRGGMTDGSLPMRYAREQKLEVDAFCIYTDNETWGGARHPCQELDRYRQATGINAKLVICGMQGNGHTFGDPSDPGTMDVVGFDSNAPAIIADFCREGGS